MEIRVNGEPERFDDVLTVNDMLNRLGLDASRVAVERNLAIVPRSAL